MQKAAFALRHSPGKFSVTSTTGKKAPEQHSADHRFDRRCRLADAESFSRVFKKPNRSRDKMFTVLYRAKENHQDQEARLGLAISKKHCKLACGRNRLKRLIRESFRTHRSGLTGLDIVVLNQAAAAHADNKALTDCLEKHWQRCRDGAAQTADKD